MPDPETKKPDPVMFAAQIGGMIILLLTAHMIFGCKKPDNPLCVLDTVPSGATIVGIRRDRTLEQLAETGLAERDPNTKPLRLETTVGTTPISSPADDWYAPPSSRRGSTATSR